MVPVMTGTEPVTLQWAWAQHNEHRTLISRLIMVGLTRYIANDFRMARYANVALLSMMAAAMLLLARKLRGSARATDVVLPLSILNVAQAESLMIGFAMNLVLTSMIAVGLIVPTGLTRRRGGSVMAMGFGVSLVLLPLCGGSGLVMLPPLALWLAGYLGWGWWSGQKPGAWTRAIGLGLLMAGVGIVAMYLHGYSRPPRHPLPPSMASVVSSTLMCLSLAIYPDVTAYWWPAGWIVVALVGATLGLLADRHRPDAGRTPARPGPGGDHRLDARRGRRRRGLRAAFGPAAILASRYVTLTIPAALRALFRLARLRQGNRTGGRSTWSWSRSCA